MRPECTESRWEKSWERWAELFYCKVLLRATCAEKTNNRRGWVEQEEEGWRYVLSQSTLHAYYTYKSKSEIMSFPILLWRGRRHSFDFHKWRQVRVATLLASGHWLCVRPVARVLVSCQVLLGLVLVCLELCQSLFIRGSNYHRLPQ